MPLLQRKREAKVGVRVAGGDGVEGAGCNRLVTSIGELVLGPLPCPLSPGGDAFGAWDLGWVTVMTGVKQSDFM